MDKRKQSQHAAIRARAAAAVAGLYHNATVNYPREFYGWTDDYFESWFQDQAQSEIEYIADGGGTPGDYRACLAAPCNGGKLKTPAARAYYIAKGMRARDAERDDCGMLTGWRVLELACGGPAADRISESIKPSKRNGFWKPARNNALWERITEYGKLYTYGRGGRTLAPDGLYDDRRQKFDADETSIPACADLIRIVESFNAHVRAWCHGVPEMWREHCEYEAAEALAEKRARSARKAAETRERNIWACRGMVTA